jgi:hypothetical protein
VLVSNGKLTGYHPSVIKQLQDRASVGAYPQHEAIASRGVLECELHGTVWGAAQISPRRVATVQRLKLLPLLALLGLRQFSNTGRRVKRLRDQVVATIPDGETRSAPSIFLVCIDA